MTKSGPLQELKHEAANGVRIECPTIPMLIHVLLQILLTVLEYKNQLRFGVNDVVQSDDVNMLQFLHQRDLADCGGWCSFFSIEMNLFQGDNLIRSP